VIYSTILALVFSSRECSQSSCTFAHLLSGNNAAVVNYPLRSARRRCCERDRRRVQSDEKGLLLFCPPCHLSSSARCPAVITLRFPPPPSVTLRRASQPPRCSSALPSQVLRGRQGVQGGLAQPIQHHLRGPGQVVLGPQGGPGHERATGVQPTHTEGNVT